MKIFQKKQIFIFSDSKFYPVSVSPTSKFYSISMSLTTKFYSIWVSPTTKFTPFGCPRQLPWTTLEGWVKAWAWQKVSLLKLKNTGAPSTKWGALLYWTLYTEQCIRYTVYCTHYTLQYTLHTVHFTLYTVQCTLYTVQCTLHFVFQIYCDTAQFQAKTVEYKLHSALYTPQEKLLGHQNGVKFGCRGHQNGVKFQSWKMFKSIFWDFFLTTFFVKIFFLLLPC